MNFKQFIDKYPSVKWIKTTLRNSLYASRRVDILEAYIVGSEAKGTATPNSDLDIAIVIPPVRGKTSIQYSEEYHAKFPDNKFKPMWNNKIVDFQFFYPSDPELNNYSKIKLN